MRSPRRTDTERLRPSAAGTDPHGSPPRSQTEPRIRRWSEGNRPVSERTLLMGVTSVKGIASTPGILGRRALPAGRLARLGATPDFHHGLLGGPDLSIAIGFLIAAAPVATTRAPIAPPATAARWRAGARARRRGRWQPFHAG